MITRFALLLTLLATLCAVLPATTARADETADTVAAICTAEGIPSGVVLVRHGDEPARTYPFGLAEIESGKPVEADSLFRVGSITKTFMAVLALKLIADGYFTLDDPITDHLPEAQYWFGHITDPRAITVRDLLQHSSGLPDYVELLAELPPVLQEILSEHDWRQVEIPRVVHNLPATFAPGTDVSYTNTGYTVLGLLMERATDRPLAELCHEYIFDPVGLDDTYYAATEQTPPQAHAYLMHEGELHDVTNLDLPQVAGAAGSILTDADDLARFATALFAGDLLTPEQWAAMTDWRAMSSRTDYGLGLMKRQYKGHMYYGHGGETLGYRAAMYWFPDDELLVLGFANLGYSEVEKALTAAIELELGLE